MRTIRYWFRLKEKRRTAFAKSAQFIAAIAATSTLAWGTAVSAYPNAQQWGWGGWKHWPDNREVYTCWLPDADVQWPSALSYHWIYMDTAVQNATSNDFVYWTNQASCENELTDIQYEYFHDPDLYGVAYCNNWVLRPNDPPPTDSVCTGYTVSINGNAIDRAAAAANLNSWWVRRYNWCHETGHAMGLGHQDTSACMRQGVSINVHHSTWEINQMDNAYDTLSESQYW